MRPLAGRWLEVLERMDSRARLARSGTGVGRWLCCVAGLVICLSSVMSCVCVGRARRVEDPDPGG